MSGLELLGAAVSAAGTVLGGIAANNQAQAEARAMQDRAKLEAGMAQRRAAEKRREAKLILSRQQALAAASGGGATDTGILDLMSKTAGQGALNARMVQWEGEEAARGLKNQADATKMSGRQALFASFIGAGSTMLSGFNEWQKYYKPPGGAMPTVQPQYRYEYG